jgi:hypothetical protein
MKRRERAAAAAVAVTLDYDVTVWWQLDIGNNILRNNKENIIIRLTVAVAEWGRERMLLGCQQLVVSDTGD